MLQVVVRCGFCAPSALSRRPEEGYSEMGGRRWHTSLFFWSGSFPSVPHGTHTHEQARDGICDRDTLPVASVSPHGFGSLWSVPHP